MCKHTVILACLSLLLASAMPAQLPIPAVTQFGQTDSSLYVSAGEAREDLDQDFIRADNSISTTRNNYPSDSILSLVSARARLWLARFGGAPASGMQIDELGNILISAGEDNSAERAFDRRLATPGLTPAERAYTLLTAVEAFADRYAAFDYHMGGIPTAARLEAAEGYLKRLNSMGVGAATRQYQAEVALLSAYDDLGNTAQVACHGIAAVHLLLVMPPFDREGMYGMGTVYPNIVRAVSVQPHGADTVAVLNKILLAATAIPMDSVAIDSGYYWNMRDWRPRAEEILKTVSGVGDTAGAVYSNRWVNLPDTTAHAMAVNDGKVRILEIGSHTCPGCVVGASGIQRIADAHPEIQAIMITWTFGSWANRVLSAEEEAPLLEHWWVYDRKIHIPIALYLAPKKVLPDSSMEADLGPPFAGTRYPEIAKPQFYILDGHGRIRATISGYERSTEREIEGIVRHLEQEAATTSVAP